MIDSDIFYLFLEYQKGQKKKNTKNLLGVLKPKNNMKLDQNFWGLVGSQEVEKLTKNIRLLHVSCIFSADTVMDNYGCIYIYLAVIYNYPYTMQPIGIHQDSIDFTTLGVHDFSRKRMHQTLYDNF